MAAAKHISKDAAVISQLDGVLTFKEEQNTALKVSRGEHLCFTLPLTGIGKSLGKHHSGSRLAIRR